jgi:hypothetical protein
MSLETTEELKSPETEPGKKYQIVFRLQDGLGWAGVLAPIEELVELHEEQEIKEGNSPVVWMSTGYEAYKQAVDENGGSAFFGSMNEAWDSLTKRFES